MHDVNRDLLVLAKALELSPEAMEREVNLLNTLLYHTENWETFCTANEVIDINRRKFITKELAVRRLLTQRSQKAFVFICNKN